MFEVILTNGRDDLSLFFKIRNTEIAHKWFSEVSQHYEIAEDDRFSNWGAHDFVNQLNYHIDIINSYDNLIDKKADNNITQAELNYLHKFFEDLRGEVTKGTTWYNSAPSHIQESLCKFNILIHKLESSIRTKNKHPTVVVTFKDSPKIELTENDMKYFTFKWTSGTVYINYCQVGKTILDVFKDGDNVADGIRPQSYYSADFMIKFGPSTPTAIYWARLLIIKIWLKFKHFNFKHLNIGMIPVADLINKVDKEELLKFNKVKKIVCTK